MKLSAVELGVVTAAYEAATDGAKWEGVLHRLARACGATKAALFTPMEGARERFLWSDVGFDRDRLIEYSSHWIKQDPWIAAHEANCWYTAGSVRVGGSYLPWPRLERLEFYNEFAAPAGVKAIVSTVLFDDADHALAPRTHLSLFRGPGMPDFGSPETQRLRRMQPHLRRAIEVYWGMARARQLPTAVQSSLNALPEPVLVLREDGSVEHANPAAEVLLRQGTLVRMRNGKAVEIAGTPGRWLAALQQARQGAAAVLPLAEASRSKGLSGFVRVAPITTNATYMSAWPNAAALVVFELRDSAEIESSAIALARQYSITPTELKVLRLLADGLAPSQIARNVNVQITTVRSHFRAIYGKTGLHRQADLVRLLTG